MANKPSRSEQIKELRRLDRQAQKLRKKLKVSAPGEILGSWFSCSGGDSQIVVQADGYGGATVMEVDGNFPVDFGESRRETFDTEEAACEAAEAWSREGSEEENG